jgi:hypothetical protein
MTPFEKESFKNFEQQIYTNYALTSLEHNLELSSVVGVMNTEQIQVILDKYGIKAFKPEAYATLFEKNTQFLNKTSPPVESFSLF